ncbi:enoyl-CoA hydratase/isomerase family protein [Novosphingobium cyanobacteriorum]|uniref:Enoyl-CoA hydratase-related protein n=1 Tax=Novosphingobium cyanobacteriorum TaxID=3024215 RepID=A0ABT6CGJ1_9SPHN|nr:enoyl-CoA hydratase-related protein [Novosphingobium cyanobacteriorum]MDF8332205.1 enoyl-CoA hydratase-related protein [Novosphingobium cyanobacteriorum]
MTEVLGATLNSGREYGRHISMINYFLGHKAEMAQEGAMEQAMSTEQTGFGSLETIQLEWHEAILIVTLNRPAALNTLTETMILELTRLFEALHQRTDVRVVILRAAGRAFCAGAELSDWTFTGTGGKVHRGLAIQRSIARIMQLMRSCPQPIIALGQGAACGGGFSLLLSSDVRLAAPSLKMNAAYIRIGLSGCDMGSSYLLPRLVGSSIASELLLTGRFIHADRALAIGLVSAVVEEAELLNAGLSLAQEMLSTNPLGLRLTKDGLNWAIDAPSMGAAMAMEDRQQILISQTDDAAEAVDAFFAKRPPNYRDA